jgi:hypothetical protein
LSPALISTPPASLSHTIFAQPVVYILPALALGEFCGWLRSLGTRSFARALLVVTFVSTNAIRDLQDYFLVWPKRGMVRLLYRAEMREAARYLNAHPEIHDVAIGSALMGPWDRIALEVDIEREDLVPRLFSPERALVWAAADGSSASGAVLLPSWPPVGSSVGELLERSTARGSGLGEGVAATGVPHLTLHRISPVSQTLAVSQFEIPSMYFANGLALGGARWLDANSLAPGREVILLTAWHVVAPLDLPPMPVVAHPPPPETYSGPRLAVFAHLSDVDGEVLVSDDGLWVDPLTLRPSDQFVQFHRFVVPEGVPEGPYELRIGLYDPKTNERWAVLEHTEGQHSGESAEEL